MQYYNLRKLSLFGKLQISAFTTLWGGFVAQEVIKFTGKYTPINQWFHFS
jgi:ubiquitin-activating enzyme E1